MLAAAVFFFFLGMPTDRGRVEKDLRPLKSRESGGLGIPLIPANTDANPAESRVPCSKAEVPRSEVKFLVKKRIVWDVHLPVFPEECPVGINDGGGIVVKAGRAPFEERGDDHHTKFPSEFLENRGRGARDRLGEVEVFVVFDLAEVDRLEKLLKADDVRALGSSLAHAPTGSGDVGFDIERAGVLDESDFDSGIWHA